MSEVERRCDAYPCDRELHMLLKKPPKPDDQARAVQSVTPPDFTVLDTFLLPLPSSFLGCAALCPFPDNLSLPAGVGCLGGCCVAASQAGLRGSSINGYRPVSDHAWRGRPTYCSRVHVQSTVVNFQTGEEGRKGRARRRRPLREYFVELLTGVHATHWGFG